MCFDHDSRPPIRADRRRGARRRERLCSTADDGDRLRRSGRAPAEPSGAGIVDPARRPRPASLLRGARAAVRGARRRGASPIDWFGRTAPDDDRGEAFDYMPHVAQTTWAGISADIAAGRRGDARRATTGDRRRTRVFTLGFCMGGRMSFLAGTLGLDLAGRHRASTARSSGRGATMRRRRSTVAPAIAVAGARAVRRRRRRDHAGGDRGLRRGAERGRHRAPAGDLPGRAAQLLRPQGGRVRRGERGGLGRDAGVRRAPTDG